MEKSFLWGKLRNLAQEAQIQEALECVPLNYKIGEAYKGKKPPTKLCELFVKNYNWIWQEVRVLVKQGLTGVQNGCIVMRGDLENIRLQLAGLVS